MPTYSFPLRFFTSVKFTDIKISARYKAIACALHQDKKIVGLRNNCSQLGDKGSQKAQFFTGRQFATTVSDIGLKIDFEKYSDL